MSNFISVSSNAVSYGPYMKPSVSWIQESKNLLRKRINKGCMLPTPIDIMEAAVIALKENAEKISGPGLFCLERSIALSSIRNNSIPETVIINCITEDKEDEYRKMYKKMAKGNIDKLNFSSSAVWQVMIKNYWKYLKSSSGVDLVVDIVVNDSKTTQSLTTMLLWSTFSEKRLSKNPFKHKSENSKLKDILSELKCYFLKIEKYAYYMRPEDPMSKSEDTKIRLHELLSYTSMCYRWLLWFMDFIDSKVLQKIKKKSVSKQGPRETQNPRELFKRHLTNGPGISSGTGVSLILSEEIYKTLSIILSISDLWTSSSWSKNIHGITKAIISAIEIVSMIHHHNQYLINLVLGGYMCWSEGGMGDPFIIDALRRQGRFNCFVGELIPTIAAKNWFYMEKSVCAWFKFALAKSLVGHDSLTNHYLSVLGSIDNPHASTEERKIVGKRRASDQVSSIRMFNNFFNPPRVPLPAFPFDDQQSFVKLKNKNSKNPYLKMKSLMKSPTKSHEMLKAESMEWYGNVPENLEINSNSEDETPYSSPVFYDMNEKMKFSYASLANLTDEEIYASEYNYNSSPYQHPRRTSSRIQSTESESNFDYQHPRRTSSRIQSTESESNFDYQHPRRTSSRIQSTESESNFDYQHPHVLKLERHIKKTKKEIVEKVTTV
uniref:Tegument protein UL46 homolog n=1 Tax=Canid alphaherpesvirus 1 TaxID=170325 RepID=A0A7T7DF89_9ALPH|nr:tegument protein VP11/12 [Canid alphaherpesvirus 1]